MNAELKEKFEKIIQSDAWDDHLNWMEAAYNLAASTMYSRNEVEAICEWVKFQTIQETHCDDTTDNFYTEDFDINELIPKKP